MSKVRVIDIGGAGVRYADVCNSDEFAVHEGSATSVGELLAYISKDLPDDCEGISYVTAGLIVGHQRVVRAPNVPWLDGVDLAEETSISLNVPAYVFNDMDGACLGMRWFIPQVQGHRFIGVTISSGVGARIVQADGTLAFDRGEIGHFCIDHSRYAPTCACGARGCVESVIGGRSLERRVLAEMSAHNLQLPAGMHPMKFLDEQYNRNEHWAWEIYQDFAEGVARFLATMIVITDCTEFVFKGTVALAMLPRIGNLDLLVQEKLRIDPAWGAKLSIRYSPSLWGQKNTDSFLGGYQLFQQMNK